MTDSIDESLYYEYLGQVNTNLSEGNKLSDDGIYVSKLNNMCLEDFSLLRSALCSRRHFNTCGECPRLINAAKDIVASGVCEVSHLFRKHFLSSYRSFNATKRFMQLPVVVFKVCQKPGMQKLYIIEKNGNVDYQTLVSLVHKFSLQSKLDKTEIAKETLRDLCNLASTESDRKLIKFAACEASGYSNRKAKENLGIHQLTKLKNTVQSAMEQAAAIRKEVVELATAKEASALKWLGLYDYVSESESDCESTTSTDQADSQVDWLSENSDNESDTTSDLGVSEQSQEIAPTSEDMLRILRESNLNWFALVAEMKLLMRASSSAIVAQVLSDFAKHLGALDLNDTERESIEISRDAYLNDERVMANDATGLTDSESDNPEDWVDLNLRSAKGKKWLLST